MSFRGHSSGGSFMPREGEYVEIFDLGRLVATGTVIVVDAETVSIAGRGIIDLDTMELRRGLNDGSMTIRRHVPDW